MRIYRDRHGNHHLVNSDGAWLTIEDGLWSYGWRRFSTDTLLYEDDTDVHKKEPYVDD